MHTYYEHTDEMHRKAMMLVEHQFMQSPAGRPYAEAFAKLDTERKALERRFMELWNGAEPALEEYVHTLVGS